MAAEIRNLTLLMIVSGPAGSGKTTLCSRMVEAFSPQVQRVITATTRPPREGERHEEDYFFFTLQEFERRVRRSEFCEWAQVHTHRYGTLKHEIQDKLKGDIDLLLSIDVQGAAAFRKAAKIDPLLAERLVTVFIMPANFEQLRYRLYQRGHDDKAEIERRLTTAEEEMEAWPQFDHRIVSGTREEDFNRLCHIYKTEKLRRKQA